MASQISLKEVDGVEIISLADNTVGFIPQLRRKKLNRFENGSKNAWAKNG